MQTVIQLQPTRQAVTSQITEISRTASDALNVLFPEQQYDEKKVQKAKELLGETAKSFTPGQFCDLVTEIQFLTDSWLDDFERDIFDGLTLTELLHERST